MLNQNGLQKRWIGLLVLAFGAISPGQALAFTPGAAVQVCAEQNGVTLPAEGQHWDKATWQKIGPCVHAAKEAAKAKCAAENQITLPADGKMSSLPKAQKHVIHACMKAAGFKHFHGHHGHHEHAGQTPPAAG